MFSTNISKGLLFQNIHVGQIVYLHSFIQHLVVTVPLANKKKINDHGSCFFSQKETKTSMKKPASKGKPKKGVDFEGDTESEEEKAPVDYGGDMDSEGDTEDELEKYVRSSRIVLYIL